MSESAVRACNAAPSWSVSGAGKRLCVLDRLEGDSQPKTNKTLKLSPEHAALALHVLIADGKLAAKDVVNALRRREQMIHDFRQRLVALEQGAASAIETAARKTARKVERKAKRKLRLSPARRAALKLHGKYLGTVRPLSKAGRAKIKAIREKSGVHAAIAAAKKLANLLRPERTHNEVT